MYKCFPVNIRLERKATSTDDFTIKTLPWRKDDVVHLDLVTVCNNTTSNKIAHVGVVIGNVPTYFETLTLTTKTYFYRSKPRIVIPSESKIIVKVVSPHDGDIYFVNIFGWIERNG